eukprot:SAG25_NODE_14452_length_255_cov_0.564103_1_plen_75_part_01
MLARTSMLLSWAMAASGGGPSARDQPERRLHKAAELAAEGGGPTPLLLAILGDIYDVSSSSKHYGMGATYHCLVG